MYTQLLKTTGSVLTVSLHFCVKFVFCCCVQFRVALAQPVAAASLRRAPVIAHSTSNLPYQFFVHMLKFFFSVSFRALKRERGQAQYVHH